MGRAWKGMFVVLGLFAGASSAQAQRYYYAPAPPPPRMMYQDPTAFRHLGLYLHADTGIGFLSSSAQDVTVSGPSWSFGASIGGALQENLIIAADVFGMAALNPNVSVSGQSSYPTSNYTLTLAGIGPELVYYFMPGNVYVSGTLAFTRLSESSDGTDYSSSDVGLGARFSLGKEWWINRHCGLGLAGQFMFSSNRQYGSGSDRISSWGAGLALTGSWN